MRAVAGDRAEEMVEHRAGRRRIGKRGVGRRGAEMVAWVGVREVDGSVGGGVQCSVGYGFVLMETVVVRLWAAASEAPWTVVSLVRRYHLLKCYTGGEPKAGGRGAPEYGSLR